MRFLPPYSLVLNPIEQVFSGMKTYLRNAAGAAKSTVEELWSAILKRGLVVITFIGKNLHQPVGGKRHTFTRPEAIIDRGAFTNEYEGRRAMANLDDAKGTFLTIRPI